MPNTNPPTIPFYTRLDVRQFASLAKYFRDNLPKVNATKSQARVIRESLNLLCIFLSKYDPNFESIEDVDEALLLLDQWGLGLTSAAAKSAAVDSLEFSSEPDFSSLALEMSEGEVEQAAEERINALLKERGE